ADHPRRTGRSAPGGAGVVGKIPKPRGVLITLDPPGKGSYQLMGNGQHMQDDLCVDGYGRAEAPGSEMKDPTMTLGPKISCSGLSHAEKNKRNTIESCNSGMISIMGATETAE